jgi:hypothetical protein
LNKYIAVAQEELQKAKDHLEETESFNLKIANASGCLARCVESINYGMQISKEGESNCTANLRGRGNNSCLA